jgi:type II secretory pathway pseudopilin PulG
MFYKALLHPLVPVMVLSLLSTGTFAQAPAAQDQQQARQLAVDIVRILNTAEQFYRTQHNRYATFDELRKSGAFPKAEKQSEAAAALAAAVGPDVGGLILRLFTSHDGSQYNLSVDDEKNQGLWAVFSNEKGLIYNGTVMR